MIQKEHYIFSNIVQQVKSAGFYRLHQSWTAAFYGCSAYNRISEHRRAVKRPLTYPDNALAAHYLEFSQYYLDADISFDILEINLYYI